MVIERDQLAAFLAIVDHGNFARAADGLGTTQSVASKRLQKLEHTLGMRLLDRGARSKVRLTRSGELFLSEARAALDAVLKAEKVGANIARGTVGPLQLGYVLSAAMSGLLARIVRNLRSALPDLEVMPRPMDTPAQLRGIDAGEIDVAIVRPRPSWPRDTAILGTYREPVILAINNADPLASLPTIGALDLTGRTLIIPQFQEEYWLSDVISQFCPGGDTTYVIRKTGDFITAAALAAAGEGVAIAPRSLSKLALEDLAFRPVADHHLSVELVAIAREELPLLPRLAIMQSFSPAIRSCTPAI